MHIFNKLISKSMPRGSGSSKVLEVSDPNRNVGLWLASVVGTPKKAETQPFSHFVQVRALRSGSGTTSWSNRHGQRPQDSSHLLQGQELPETYRPQGHTVQNRQSKSVCTGSQGHNQTYIRENDDMIGNRVDTVVKRNLCSTQRSPPPK
jgi:hypothetical protein